MEQACLAAAADSRQGDKVTTFDRGVDIDQDMISSIIIMEAYIFQPDGIETPEFHPLVLIREANDLLEPFRRSHHTIGLRDQIDCVRYRRLDAPYELD